MKKYRIFLADDHVIIREGIRLILSQDPDIEIIGESSDGREALERIEALKPDVAILDISIPSILGIDVAREIKQFNPAIRILILSQYDNDEYIREAMKIGIEGYILKQDASSDLRNAVKAVINGYHYLSPQITSKVVNDYTHQSSKKDASLGNQFHDLSKREREILKLVSEGKKNREIASLLFISDQTVKVHRKNIMKKLHINNITELVRYAVKQGLIE